VLVDLIMAKTGFNNALGCYLFIAIIDKVLLIFQLGHGLAKIVLGLLTPYISQVTGFTLERYAGQAGVGRIDG
jgi:hypothetical protein